MVGYLQDLHPRLAQARWSDELALSNESARGDGTAALSMRGRSSSPTGARLQSLGGGALENGRRVFGPVLRLLHLQEGCVRREEAAGDAQQRCPRSRSTVRAFTTGSVGQRAHRTQPLSDTLPTSAPALGSPVPTSAPRPGSPVPTSAPGVGSPLADPSAPGPRSHPSQICAGTGLTADASAAGPRSPYAPGLGPARPHLHRDWAHLCPHLHRDRAHPCHICAGTALAYSRLCGSRLHRRAREVWAGPRGAQRHRPSHCEGVRLRLGDAHPRGDEGDAARGSAHRAALAHDRHAAALDVPPPLPRSAQLPQLSCVGAH